jgi:hypothetical protein
MVISQKPRLNQTRRTVARRFVTRVLVSPTAEATAASLAAEVAGLRELNAALRDQLADVKTDRDRWRDQAEAAKRQLGGPGGSGGRGGGG